MAVRASNPPGGANGSVWRYDFADGDTFDLILERYVDFVERGIVATIDPEDGASITMTNSLDTEMQMPDEAQGSPFTETNTVHINNAFQRMRIAAAGGGGAIQFLLPIGDPRGFKLIA